MTTRQANVIYFTDGDYIAVGGPWTPREETPRKGSPEVTAITVTDDLPGLHCNMERVRVFVGETCVFEAPVHSLEGVGYPQESGDAALDDIT